MPASFDPEPPEVFAIICAAIDQISEALTGATKRKLDSHRATILINMFERVLDLISKTKELRGSKVIVKLTVASNVVSMLLRRAMKVPIQLSEVGDLMEMLDEILQLIDNLTGMTALELVCDSRDRLFLGNNFNFSSCKNKASLSFVTSNMFLRSSELQVISSDK